MSYFQLVVNADIRKIEDIQRCLDEIIESGIKVLTVEQFIQAKLIGFNIEVQDVNEKTERTWAKIINQTIDTNYPDIQVRFRFFNSITKSGSM